MSRFYVICFDVCDSKRLRRVAIALENVGRRVQYSVFECYLGETLFETLKKQIGDIIDPDEDHVRYYPLCGKDIPKIVISGPGCVTANDDYHVV